MRTILRAGPGLEAHLLLRDPIMSITIRIPFIHSLPTAPSEPPSCRQPEHCTQLLRVTPLPVLQVPSRLGPCPPSPPPTASSSSSLCSRHTKPLVIPKIRQEHLQCHLPRSILPQDSPSGTPAPSWVPSSLLDSPSPPQTGTSPATRPPCIPGTCSSLPPHLGLSSLRAGSCNPESLVSLARSMSLAYSRGPANLSQVEE